jgi:hypothetical protein
VTHRHTPTALAILLTASCAAPARLSLHRSPLLDPPEEPLTPEGRPNLLPSRPGPDRSAQGIVPASGPDAAASSAGEERAVDGAALAQAARGFLGLRTLAIGGKRYPNDCTGLVRAVYATQNVDLMAEGGRPGDSGVMAIWRYAGRHGSIHAEKPGPGDIVFFRETYDRNRDGRENDGLTHVGIVESVESDGTVGVIHRVAHGVMRYHMNLEHPRERRDPATGRVLNDYLREGRRSRLAAELFAGFATLTR